MRMTDILANYKLERRTTFQGLSISIETDKGSTREGVDKKTGKAWKVRMTWPYGYIRMSRGVDGDHVDCFIGPNPNASNAYVIHTVNPSTGDYDEDKVMLGWDSPADAKKAFLENYSSPKFFGSLETIPMDRFREKVLATKDRPAKIAAAGWKLGTIISLYAGGPGSGCHGDKCGRPKGSQEILDKIDKLKKDIDKTVPKSARIQKMTKDVWISKDGTAFPVKKLDNGHLTSILRQLHEQLALARGDKTGLGKHVLYQGRVGQEGYFISRVIAPYESMVQEAKKRGLNW